MRTKLLVFVILTLSTTWSFAQWVVQTTPVTAEMRGIYFTSTTTGYAVGSTGTMIKTTDAGNTWVQLFPLITDTLRSVFFTDDLTGYAVGSQGRIIKTTDSGATWNTQVSNDLNLLRSVYFPAHDTGYICGGGGVILKTVDAGTTWTHLTSGITQDLINIRFNNVDTGYAVSSLSTFLGGIILKTVDAGLTWNTVYSDVNIGFLSLAVKGDVVYAGGYGETILQSVDAGVTWSTLNSTGSTSNLRSASFINENNGLFVGDAGLIYTTNNGSTFNLVTPAITTNGLLGTHFINADTIYACGNLGTVIRYTTPCTPPMPAALYGPDTLCSNTTQTYWINAVPGAASYVWNTPTGSIIQSGQGDTLIVVLMGSNSGVVSVSSANGCGQSFPANIAVSVYASPTTPTIVQTGQVLASSATSGNQWYLNGVIIPGPLSQAQIYSPTQNGLYSVIVTSPNGCTASSSSFNWTSSSISENNFAFDVNLIPQPASDFAMLKFQLKKQTTLSISVYDLTGKKVIDVLDEKQLSGFQSIKIDCNNLNKGIYVVKMEAEKINSWMKLIKD